MAEDAAKPKHRVVKKAETVREIAEKSSQSPVQKEPGIIRLTLKYIGAPFRWVGRGLAKIGHKQPFKFIGHVLWPAYFRNSWKELRQVTWPNRRESTQLTTAVIIFATIFGVMIALVDYGLDKLFKQVLLK
ncbi:MAG TPA: preprotein translocase subunit SecE [Candidatus Saccharimonadales bacterium]